MNLINKLDHLENQQWSKLQRRYEAALSSLGPFCAELLLWKYAKKTVAQWKQLYRRWEFSEFLSVEDVSLADEILSGFDPFLSAPVNRICSSRESVMVLPQINRSC